MVSLVLVCRSWCLYSKRSDPSPALFETAITTPTHIATTHQQLRQYSNLPSRSQKPKNLRPRQKLDFPSTTRSPHHRMTQRHGSKNPRTQVIGLAATRDLLRRMTSKLRTTRPSRAGAKPPRHLPPLATPSQTTHNKVRQCQIGHELVWQPHLTPKLSTLNPARAADAAVTICLI